MAQSKTRISSAGALLLLLLCSSVSSLSLASPTSSSNSNEPSGLSEQVVDQLNDNELYNNNKRAWQSLQSSWGKRSNDMSVGDDIYMTGHFVPLVITDGTNTLDWNTFERLASNSGQDPPQSSEDTQDYSETDNTLDKRAWKNMNVGWGKRRQAAEGWNKFRGSWGKREPTWTNLKGVWGKRDQWQKLHGGWGKRSSLN